ncbi:hypothetical protein QBC35DRAFT_13602 [Podospora australis]|uniref:Uncharacterized protein n=1 Tax=Podospora australis TaxID=1536484 RepID=A0AAN6WZZ7_9PEZI|nr:hypothetical protein QBC35DRAFT_13602 [Podospora australis]
MMMPTGSLKGIAAAYHDQERIQKLRPTLTEIPGAFDSIANYCSAIGYPRGKHQEAPQSIQLMFRSPHYGERIPQFLGQLALRQVLGKAMIDYPDLDLGPEQRLQLVSRLVTSTRTVGFLPVTPLYRPRSWRQADLVHSTGPDSSYRNITRSQPERSEIQGHCMKPLSLRKRRNSGTPTHRQMDLGSEPVTRLDYHSTVTPDVEDLTSGRPLQTIESKDQTATSLNHSRDHPELPEVMTSEEDPNDDNKNNNNYGGNELYDYINSVIDKANNNTNSAVDSFAQPDLHSGQLFSTPPVAAAPECPPTLIQSIPTNTAVLEVQPREVQPREVQASCERNLPLWVLLVSVLRFLSLIWSGGYIGLNQYLGRGSLVKS